MKTAKISIVLAVLFSCSIISATAFASVSDDQVTSQKIKEADGTSGQNTNSGSGVKTNHIQNSAVTTNKIADGAVTDAKIIGPISASKIQKTSNVVTVAQSGGDFTSIQSAINSIAPSAASPYLVKVMPGTYSETITLKSYVHLQGSGANTTVIKSTQDTNIISMSGLTDVMVSDFTIQGPGTLNGYGNGFYVYETAPLTIRDNVIAGHVNAINTVRSGSSSAIVKVANNTFRGNRTSLGFGYSSFEVTNNLIAGTTVRGFEIGASSGVIWGNRILDNGNTAIDIQSASSVDIMGNTIRNCAYEGIQFIVGSTGRIQSNLIDNCGEWGIRILDSSYATIVYNTITNHSALDIWVDNSSAGANVSFNIYNTLGIGWTVSDTIAVGQYNVKTDGSPAPAP